jgi:hypothetical protein
MSDAPDRKKLGRKPRRSHNRWKLSPGNMRDARSTPKLEDPAVLARQIRAFDLRATGATIVSIAGALGVDRSTIARDLQVETERRRVERSHDRAALIEQSAARHDQLYATLRADVFKLGDLADAAASRGDFKREVHLRSVRSSTLRTMVVALSNFDTLHGLRRDEADPENHLRGPIFELALATFAMIEPDRRMEILRRAAAVHSLKNVTEGDDQCTQPQISS